MTTILLIRHGETEWNAGEIFRGQADIELNEVGMKQAQLLAAYLKELPLTAIYASPLKRAFKTAATIAESRGIAVTAAHRLTDFDYGEWQGLSHEAVQERYGVLYEKWLNAPQSVKMPGGESLDDVRARASALVNELIVKHEGNIALVSHRVVGKVLICALLGLDDSHFWNIRLDTCGITSFAYEKDRFVLIQHNDISFLKSLDRPALKDF